MTLLNLERDSWVSRKPFGEDGAVELDELYRAVFAGGNYPRHYAS